MLYLQKLSQRCENLLFRQILRVHCGKRIPIKELDCEIDSISTIGARICESYFLREYYVNAIKTSVRNEWRR